MLSKESMDELITYLDQNVSERVRVDLSWFIPNHTTIDHEKAKKGGKEFWKYILLTVNDDINYNMVKEVIYFFDWFVELLM